MLWHRCYREAELYKAALRLYTKALFDSQKALFLSTDGQTLYDFARRGTRHLQDLHVALARREFQFRPARAVHRVFHGKPRTLYISPWPERIVSLLLYRLISRRLDAWYAPVSYAYRWRGFGLDRCQRDIARALRRSAPCHVFKRDLTNFFGSLDHGILLDKVAALVPADDYLFQLIRQTVQFAYVDEQGQRRQAERGVPFGTAMACALANIYLTDLDRRLAGVQGAKIFRYADDLLVIAQDSHGVEQAAAIYDDEIARLRLQSKPTHEEQFFLTVDRRDRATSGWPRRDRFRHLGLEFRADGSIGLSRDKARKICNLFRFAWRRYQTRLNRCESMHSRARLAIAIARRTMQQAVRNVAIIDYYLRHVTDEQQLKQLDRWLAEEVLARACGNHKKGNFRLLPFGELRKMGLPSLVHRRRLLQHGHIHSAFFVWQSRRLRRRPGGKVARPKPPASAFSQGPEAAADEP